MCKSCSRELGAARLSPTVDPDPAAPIFGSTKTLAVPSKDPSFS